jgi:transcription elongation factor Elf1
MIVHCDKCPEEFEISMQKTKIEADVERNYFSCPYCSAEYTSFYTNKSIRNKQVRIRNLWSRIRKTKNVKKIDNIQEQIDELKKQLAAELHELRTKYE